MEYNKEQLVKPSLRCKWECLPQPVLKVTYTLISNTSSVKQHMFWKVITLGFIGISATNLKTPILRQWTPHFSVPMFLECSQHIVFLWLAFFR